MISTFLIALREGLEAALIVGILVAYLVRSDRRHLLPALWSGVAAAVIASLGAGAILSFTSAELSGDAEPIFAGGSALLATVLVTWMVFWMKRQARHLKGELHGKLDKALMAGPFALALAAFFAVAREGLETALFLYSQFTSIADDGFGPLAGLLLGLLAATILGYGIYRQSVKINLSRFFTISGSALIVIVAGLLSYAVAEFQEIGWLPGAASTAWNFTSVIADGGVIDTVLTGTIGFHAHTTTLAAAVWVSFLVITLWLYLKPAQSRQEAPQAPAHA